MQSAQESKQELEAAIRYAENAISSAKQTIESMEFRQEMAQKQFSEQTGREQALQSQVKLLEERIADMSSDMVGDAATIKQLNEEREMLEKNVKYLRDENERLKREKEASSGPCGCQAYRDLEEKVGDLKSEVNALEQPERPTMPVIPKAVAIAIFREGMAYGVSNACDELDNAADIEISETGYTGDFEVSFSTNIDLSEHLDLDWMRDKVGDYDEASVIEALKNLCADKEFECRIHGVDDEESDSKGS
jgi:predicted nuclease with TOPRIM domain